jgi:hypothetical protein
MLTINDDQLAQQLTELAKREQRSVEDLLKSLLAQYPHQTVDEDIEQAMRGVRQKAYAQARRYWQETGSIERLALTDADLDEQFWLFDGEGIPRLKSEHDQVQLTTGSLYALAQEAAKARIQFHQTEDDVDYDEILNNEFADYLLNKMQDENGSSNSD